MKRALLYIGIALAAIGCTKDADVETPLGDNALTFTSNITTRADKSAWADKDAIGVYMTTSADATFGDGGANKEYTTNGDGKFSSTDPLYLPSSGSVEILAYYPYDDFKDGGAIDAYPIKSADQVDLLRATDDEVSSSNVALQFDHLLSKVSLTIEAETGVLLQKLENLVVTISGIGTKTTAFNLTEPSAAVTFSESTELKFDTSITRRGEDGALSDSPEDSVVEMSSSAIVIPQSLSGATLIFTLSFTEESGKSDETYSATIPAKAFVTGLEYTYDVTLKESGEVTISSASINKWEDGDETSGTADIVDIEYKSSDKKYHINSAKGLAAFSDLVYGAGSNTKGATIAGFSEDLFKTDNTTIDGVLTRDIDLSDVCGSDDSKGTWNPIGRYFSGTTYYYEGEFDGGGYKVSNLYINASSKQALFGYIGTDGVVYNLGVSGEVTGSSSEVGGFVSWNEGYVMNCYSEVNVTGITNVAGIAGYNEGYVVNCYNRGNIDGDTNVGGIVGQSAAGGYVGYSFSVGDISGVTRVGGVVGYNHLTTAEAPSIKGCFCLNNTENSIGQLESVTASGSYKGNMYDRDYLTSDIFAAIMNNGTVTYNSAGNDDPVDACAWNDNSTSDYPTLNFGVVNKAKKWIYDIVYSSDTQTYDIYTAMGLKAFAYLVNGDSIDDLIEDDKLATSGNYDLYFDVTDGAKSSIKGQLMNDIDLENEEWTPIGNDYDNAQYSGTFNGNGKEVSNLYIDNTTTDFQGLFGSSSGTISNIGVSVDITGKDSSIGGVVGYNSGTITNCYSSGTGVSSTGNSGGVVGSNTGYIINCYNSGSVSSTSNGSCCSGGIVGYSSGIITNCYNSGKVSGTSSSVGGVVGNNNSGTITSCYWDSSVTGTAANGVGTGTDGGVSDTKDMEVTSFITRLNSNAYTYNNPTEGNKPTVTACAWEEGTDGYPTLSFGADPGITYSKLANFSTDSYPTGNVWYITDTDEEETADEASEFDGLEDALKVANTSGNITVIFSNLKTLPTEAFSGCKYLTTISLPSATDIGDSAFSGCTALTTISLPSATEIGENAFENCSALTELDLGSSGSGITSIGANAFYEDTDTTIAGDIDLTIKIASDATGVSVEGEDGKTLKYNTSETATFKSITVITNWALND